MTGTLYGIGVGPGDPELVTVKAARLIAAAPVVAYHCAGHGRSLARAAAAPYLHEGQTEERLVYPLTKGGAEQPGYRAAIDAFYAAAAERLAQHLAAGRDVALLAEGDPTLFSSYAHMHKRLETRFRCVIVPGVTAVAAAAAAAGTPLVEGEQVLSVLPGTLPEAELRRRLADADAAAVLKVSSNLPGIRAALADRLADAVYVRRATHPDQHVGPLTEVNGEIPYMATVLVPPRPRRTTPGVVVVGLGPAGAQWRTPEATAELAAADDLVGYRTYLDRVPVRPGQQRHATDNRVELERAEFALDLARRGRRVAVVSSGDPGVFAMASAVLEARDGGYPDVAVRIVPGLTAATAVAARVGAPLGHDHAVLSLSDQLKPWPVIRQRLDTAAAADLVLALYNPGSRSRDRRAEVRDILLAHRAPGTPVIVGRAVGSDDEQVEIIRLAELAACTVDMRTLLIVGSSRTVATGGMVWTPRSY